MHPNLIFIFLLLYSFSESSHLISPRALEEDILTPARYHNYKDLKSIFKKLQKTFPNQAKVFTIGQSVKGKTLLAIQINANVNKVNRLTPKFKYVANVHGDETVGRQLTIYLAQYLLHNYGKDARITSVVNRTNIFLLPSLNPDGFEKTQLGSCRTAKGRTNQNGIDLDHDFPDKQKGLKTRSDSVQPETEAMMRWMQTSHFVLSGDLRGGSIGTTYPHFYESRGTQEKLDDVLFKKLSLVYFPKNVACEYPSEIYGAEDEYEPDYGSNVAGKGYEDEDDEDDDEPESRTPKEIGNAWEYAYYIHEHNNDGDVRVGQGAHVQGGHRRAELRHGSGGYGQDYGGHGHDHGGQVHVHGGYGHVHGGYGHDHGGQGHVHGGYGHDHGAYGHVHGGYGQDYGGHGHDHGGQGHVHGGYGNGGHGHGSWHVLKGESAKTGQSKKSGKFEKPGGTSDGHPTDSRMRDFTYHGTDCIELTIMLSCCQSPPVNMLKKLWFRNKQPLISYIEAAQWGVKGTVVSDDGYPIADARILIKGADRNVKTTRNGEYWRMLPPGDYEISVIAHEYQETIPHTITVTKDKTIVRDFTLTRNIRNILRERKRNKTKTYFEEDFDDGFGNGSPAFPKNQLQFCPLYVPFMFYTFVMYL